MEQTADCGLAPQFGRTHHTSLAAADLVRNDEIQHQTVKQTICRMKGKT